MPVPGGTITSAKAVFDSPHGRVENSWMIEDGKFIMDAVVPPNTSALIKLPGQETVNSVGSGSFHFEIPYIAPEWPIPAIKEPFAS